MKGLPASFAARLKTARQAAGLTQEQLALRPGFAGRQTVNNYERGLSDPPLSLVGKLATFLRVAPAWLAGWSSRKASR